MIKYSPRLSALVDVGPQISELINPNKPFAQLSLLGKVALVYFPSMHPFNTSSYSVLRTGTPVEV